jgi:hypothetical protein
LAVARFSTLAIRALAVLSLAVAVPRASRAGSGVVDGIRSFKRDGDLAIEVDLAVEAQYLSHALSASGDVLQIRLLRVNSSRSDTAEISGRDRVEPTGALAALVSEVSGGGEPTTDFTLTVRFTRAVHPIVGQGANRQVLSIRLPAEDVPELKSAGFRDESVGTPSSAPPTDRSSQPSVQDFEMTGEPMEDARRAITANDYPAAIRLLTKVLQSADSTHEQEAHELLGVARERNHQLAHAKAEYQEYLRLYPEGEGADRVRQRLAALLTFGREPEPAAAVTTGEAEPSRPRATTDYSGSLSQYFRRDSSISDEAGETFSQSFLATDADLFGRLRTDNYDLRAQASGGYRFDIEGSGTGSDTRLRYLYVDATHRGHQLNARLGRQSRSTGGVQGRFDGGLVSHQTWRFARFNLVGGSPVDLTQANAIDTDRYFYGLSVDLGTFAERWDSTLYAIEQRVSDILDRRAVGAEIRYVRPEASLFTLIDYDVSYNSLNTLLMFGNYRFGNGATVGFSIDVRDSPSLTTSNALIGQPVDSIDDLLDVADEDEVRDFAEDRTARSQTYTLSGSYPLSETFQLASDFTVAEFSSTETSGGVEGTPATGWEYFYSLQLIGTELVRPADVHVLSLRYADTDTTDTAGLMLNSRFADIGNWRLNPRFRFDFQQLDGGSGATLLRPSLLVDYRWRRSLTLEFEGGYEWVADLYGDADRGRNGYYLYVGYRWDF